MGLELGISMKTGLIVLNLDDESMYKVYDNSCYGFTYNNKGYFLKTNDKDVNDRCILVMDKNFNILHQISDKQDYISPGHQMQYHRNKLWLASPGEEQYQNNIYIYDLLNNTCKIWCPIRDKRRLHYNSLFFRNDNLFILAHNYKSNPGYVFVFDYKNKKIISTIELQHGCGHNIFCINGKLLSCDSKHSSIIDVGSGDIILDTVVNGGDFLRGVALNDDYLFVGSSQWADGDHRYCSTSNLLIYDVKTLDFIKKIEFFRMGGIHDVRILNDVDYAHTTGE